MSYNLIWDKKAYDILEKLEPIISRRISKLIKEFSLNPKSKDIKRIKGEDAFRLRAGDYRILLDIDHNKKLIKILKIGHRKRIYDR